MTSSERAATQVFFELPLESRAVIEEWLARGHTMADAIIRSNALGKKGEPLVTPRDARRERLRLMDIRQAAEHEASHAVTAQALGLQVKYAKINADGSGVCVHARGGTKLQNAIVLMAPELWIERFRSDYFVYGPKGLENDNRGLIEIGDRFILRDAMDHCMTILKQNRAILLLTADQIEKSGHVVLPWQ